MGERILDEVEDLAVELGLGAVHFQLDLLAEIGGEIPHHARQFLPDIANRLHAGFHHPFLQLGGDVGESLQRPLELGFLVLAHDFQELIAGEHQLGDHGHEFFQRLHMDADGLAGHALFELIVVFADPIRRRRSVFGLVLRVRGRVGCSGEIRGTGCFPKCPLDLVERHFAWTKGTFQYLVDQRSTRGPRNRDCALGGRAGRHALEQVDQVPVRPFWFSLAVFELDKDLLDAIDGGKNERDGLGGDGKTIAKPAHQRLRRMRKRLQPRQSEKSAGAFDRVDQAEDVVEDLGVVRIPLEADQLDVDDVEALIGLGQEFAQQFVHGNAPGREATRAACPAPVASEASLLGNGLRLVAPLPKRCGGRQIPGAFRPSEPAAGAHGKQFVSSRRQRSPALSRR